MPAPIAGRDTRDLASTLARTLRKLAASESANGAAQTSPTSSTTGEPPPAAAGKQEPTDAEIATAAERITEYLELNEFAEWEPSQHIRIKLVAPNFPRRVLKSVKWLGDVYNMPIEAIAVRLFQTGAGELNLTFERVLPLPDDGEFDLTVRRREERKRSENTKKRPAIVPVLLAEGLIKEGQRLWLSETALRPEDRPKYNAEDVVFQVEVRANGTGKAQFAWRPTAESPEVLLSPSVIPHRVTEAISDDWAGEPFHQAVSPSFIIGPKGVTLEQLAAEHGVWDS